MSAATAGPHSLPYMTGDDPLASVALRIKELADQVNARLPISGKVGVPVTASNLGSATVTLPAGRFSVAPRVVVSVSENSVYFASVISKAANGSSFVVQVAHRNLTEATTNIDVDWVALPV